MLSTNNNAHGGDEKKGRRKAARPLRIDRMIHVVYRSTKAVGEKNFRRPANARLIAEILDRTLEETGVQSKAYANVGNHCHLLLRGRTKEGIQRFLRVFPQRVALALAGAKKGEPRGKFFDRVAYTRIVEWGEDYVNTRQYLVKNCFEAMGHSAAEARALHRQIRSYPMNRLIYLEDMARTMAAIRAEENSVPN